MGAVVLIALALLSFRLAFRPKMTSLHLIAFDLWMLDRVCRATGAMLRAGDRPELVTIDLGNLDRLDSSTVASLRYACARWSEAGARVSLEGCNPNVEQDLRRAGLHEYVTHASREERGAPPTTLH
jgi:anti-anti-sigma regulatory factor